VRILVPNLGSTSLKYQLFDTESDRVLARGKIERIGCDRAQITTWDANGKSATSVSAVTDHRSAIQTLIQHLNALRTSSQGKVVDAVGFKAVHGGPDYRGTFLVSDEMLEAMKDFSAVAPVHNGIYIQAMQIFRSLLPQVPMVAVFEAGFHVTIPACASTYGIPNEWMAQYGALRYGFHGSSHRYISERVPEVLQRSGKGLRLVSCHLGGSSSVCAIRDGQSVDSSFGFSPQSGVEHAARCGDLDPFVVLYVMEKEKLTPAQVREILCKKGGLLGISGVGSDLRDLEEAAEKGNLRAKLAIDVLTYEVRKYIGAFAAAMGGLDALSFAGGIGENSWRVREEATRGLEFLEIRLDRERNRAGASGDRIISASDSEVKILVIYTNEEEIVARETRRLLAENNAA
jgi:acetate kinase